MGNGSKRFFENNELNAFNEKDKELVRWHFGGRALLTKCYFALLGWKIIGQKKNLKLVLYIKYEEKLLKTNIKLEI